MAIVLRWLAWILVIVALALVPGGFFVPSAYLEPLRHALPAGVLLAIAGHLFTQVNTSLESAEKLSKFYLESCVEAYEEARKLLMDENNDRAVWIAAGRALIHANELASKVTVAAHRRVLELHKLKYRGFFHGVIASKPAAFFYGAPDASIPLDDAAAQSTARTSRNGRVIVSTVNELSSKSLYAIWMAAQWPQEYEDPLSRDFSDDEQNRLMVQYPGLHEFLDHKKRWSSAAGRLVPRVDANSRQAN